MMTRFSVTVAPIDVTKLSARMRNNMAGAFVSFEGWVRNHNEGLPVHALEYEIFDALAMSEGQAVLNEAVKRFNLLDACAQHRAGPLAIGDCAIWIGVTARHRAEAFDGCRYIIDEVKHRLPVWKKEHYEGLEPQWVNCQHQHHHIPVPSVDEREFYARQMILPEIGVAGQKRLSDARVLVVGAGGLGSAAALALAGAGVGHIGLADHDHLAASNLHRQVLYSAADVGKPKATLAAARLRALNPLIEVEAYNEKTTADNVESLFEGYDLVLDCSDNFTTKYLLNDAAILYGKPVVQASIYRFEGQLLTIDLNDGAGCLRCLFPQAPAAGMVGDCATVGVLGTVPMLFGTLQANETIKRILNLETSTDLVTLDTLSLRMQSFKRARRPDCDLCGDHATRKTPDPHLDISGPEEELRARFTLIDVREASEIAERPLPGALHIPSSSFKTDAIAHLKDQPVLLVCAQGVRSETVARRLRAEGWMHAHSLSGGCAAWNQPKGCPSCC